MATIFCYLLFDSNHLQFAGFSSISETIAHKDILTAAGSSGAEVLQHLSVTSKKAFTMTPQPIYSMLPKYFNWFSNPPAYSYFEMNKIEP